MGRKSRVGYWTKRRQYITWVAGKRHVLLRDVDDDRPDGPNFSRAATIFNAIETVQSDPLRSDVTVGGCIGRYLRHLETHGAAGTLRGAKAALLALKEDIGGIETSKFKPANLEDAIDLQQTWNSSTRKHVWDRMKRCMSWNVERGEITVNPLHRVKCPDRYRAKQRGAECFLPADLIALLIDRADGHFRNFLVALRDTGARPGELMNAERSHYRDDPPHVFFSGDPDEKGYKWKCASTKKHGDNSRRVFLSPALDVIARRNLQRSRWLFPHDEGQWTPNRLARAFARLTADKAIRGWMKANPTPQRRIIPYSFRHTYITRCIQQGRSASLIAALCGTSVGMIERHYSHVLSLPHELAKIYLTTI